MSPTHSLLCNSHVGHPCDCWLSRRNDVPVQEQGFFEKAEERKKRFPLHAHWCNLIMHGLNCSCGTEPGVRDTPVEEQGNWKTRLPADINLHRRDCWCRDCRESRPAPDIEATIRDRQIDVPVSEARFMGHELSCAKMQGDFFPCTCDSEPSKESSVEATIRDRGKTYGDFKDVAATSYELQQVMLRAMNGRGLNSPEKSEALKMICTKIARLLHGDPNDVNSWHDIAGYATLAERSCKS